MFNFSLQKKVILGGLALLLVADLAFAYLTVRLSGSREDRQQSLAAQARQIALIKADVKRATEIREKTPEVLRKLDQFEGSLLPAAKGYSVVTQEIDEYAKDAHLLKNDVRYHEKDVTGRSNLTELGMEISVEGDYNGIVKFLNKIQRSKSVYIVDALGVESQSSAQAPVGTLKVNLHLRTYFRKA
jgi:type IV pilus assembly protein PilO